VIETLVVSAAITSVVAISVGWVFKRTVDAVLGVHRAAQAQWAAERRNMNADWNKERQQLLERIQRPERTPLVDLPTQPAVGVEGELDESYLVGQIHWDDSFLSEGLEDADAEG
jgi:hypothetical protein